LPAIVGYVTGDMIQCIAAFLDFCYLARRSAHYTSTLVAMDEALARFHHFRDVFRHEGVRPDGFSLPRQHALVHYVPGIRLFASPNGICTSITESKHIRAVKEPYRRSSHFQALGQILHTNTRLSKLAAATVEFREAGMLYGDVVAAAEAETGIEQEEEDWEMVADEEGEALEVDGPRVDSRVELASRPGA
jgi:hypothetical protein